jgi:hypothetical protein
MNPGRTSSTPSLPLLDGRQSAPANAPDLATPVATVLAA